MPKTYAERSKEIRRDPRRRAAIERETAAILAANRLARIREAAGLTQADVARNMGVTQTRVSKIELAEDVQLSTLQRYVAALGGHLEARAIFDDEEPVAIMPSGEREGVPA